MRPPAGVQRGSVLNENGDPTTPGYASLPGVHRVPEDSLPGPHIPVIPMGYGNAQRILALLTGPAVPDDWQGGLPFHYHVGAGPARVRLRVRTERGVHALHPIWDTFGVIRGAVYPDEWVIVGAHRDAWSPGAGDNVSGTVTVLEVARAFAELARAGHPPARTLIFATWDAEEWALIGSTEWVEEHEDSLREHAVAYLNEDDVTSGPRFEGAASPSLKPLLVAATRGVPGPEGRGSVYDGWLARVGSPAALELGNLGGGSDFAGFTHHLGIPSLGAGFSGPSGVYHSTFDSYDWMSRFGDPGYREHRALARLVGVILARLANAELLPFDYEAFGTELAGLVAPLDSGLAARHWDVSTAPLRAAIGRLSAAGRVFATARDSALASGLPGERAARANRWLMQVERRLTRPQGLVGRPWYRSLEFAADPDNGYATLAFPSVSEALRSGDAAATERELADLVSHVDLAREALEQATAALR
jgi:N-acetylated-alpha-linked acidic dipeptidase